MFLLEFKLNTKEGTVDKKIHLFIFIKFIKKNERKKALKLQMRKMKKMIEENELTVTIKRL